MAYTPTEWKTGDVVTAAKLNNMENGIASAGGGGGSAMILTANFSEEHPQLLGATAKEIYDAFTSGTNVIIQLYDYDDESSRVRVFHAISAEKNPGDSEETNDYILIACNTTPTLSMLSALGDNSYFIFE